MSEEKPKPVGHPLKYDKKVVPICLCLSPAAADVLNDGAKAGNISRSEFASRLIERAWTEFCLGKTKKEN